KEEMPNQLGLAKRLRAGPGGHFILCAQVFSEILLHASLPLREAAYRTGRRKRRWGLGKQRGRPFGLEVAKRSRYAAAPAAPKSRLTGSKGMWGGAVGSLSPSTCKQASKT